MHAKNCGRCIYYEPLPGEKKGYCGMIRQPIYYPMYDCLECDHYEEVGAECDVRNARS